MRRVIAFLLLITLSRVRCDETKDVNCKNVKETSPTRKLKDYLFCEYDTSLRPSNKQDVPVVVDIRMLPQFVEFSEEDNILYLHTWLAMAWRDEHLSWDPSKWENVKDIRVKSYEIWRPELTVFNSGDMGDEDGISIMDCMLNFNGTVNCIAPNKYTSHCPTDYSEWPYDKHNCTLQMGVWMFYHNEVLLTFASESLSMEAFMQNKEWDVSMDNQLPEYIGQISDEGTLMIIITVMLQRHGARLAIIYILPAFVLMVLTLIVLWLDSQSLERIFVACINFICHILGIFDLHWYFPDSGSETTPKILLFYETSVGLSTLALILTCLLRKLRDTNVPAPMWLVSGTALILNSPIGVVLKLNIMDRKKEPGIFEDAEVDGQIVASRKDRTWQELAVILEWFTFIAVFLIYIIMLAVILPAGPPKHIKPTHWF